MAETTVDNKTPIQLAFIIDNEIVDIIHTDERLAAVFQSQPVVIDVTKIAVENPLLVSTGSKYNPETGEFTAPVRE